MAQDLQTLHHSRTEAETHIGYFTPRQITLDILLEMQPRTEIQTTTEDLSFSL